MIGLMLNLTEAKEFEYLLKKEMEDLLFDLQDDRLDKLVMKVMEERYQVLFKLFSRLAAPAECTRFCRRKQSHT
ncbi:hypothetical protein [Fictibacillus terranigra]|uniref:Uncharacterized protein n=1 Tax=Fictibacillus terranigra TaxID=3058424 RepID=A0ABT8EE93_9BACL|nr:hypothetical protein [Fictibacillus sp. CENA-BCM004]MDN4076144.1 hypothetical protein [Fictibacillus sp. CENA-BCM004]